MEIKSIDDVVAFRELKCGCITVKVYIGRPILFPDGDDYFCPFCIELGDKKKCSYSGGVDSVQALKLAMEKVKVELDWLSQKKGEEMLWLDNEPGEIGF